MSIDAKQDKMSKRGRGRPRKPRSELSEWSRRYGSTLAERRRLREMREQDRQYIRDYVANNWEDMTDEEMATELMVSTRTISSVRKKMGLFRRRKTPEKRVPLKISDIQDEEIRKRYASRLEVQRRMLRDYKKLKQDEPWYPWDESIAQVKKKIYELENPTVSEYKRLTGKEP